MVDFIKAVIPPKDIPLLYENDILDFKQEVSIKTGEMSNREIAEYHNLKFIVYAGSYAEIKGSLHKFFNGGLHNANDFSLMDLLITISQIKRLFKIDLMTYKLSNIEFGVNVPQQLKASKIVHYLLIHRQELFENQSVSDGVYKQARHAQYFVKAYDKGRHLRKVFPFFKGEILRFELKFIKMKKLNELGFFQLVDLFQYEILENVTQLLETGWNESLMYDYTIQDKRLKKYDRQVKLNQWQNVNYWLQLTKQRRYEERKAYQSIVEAYSDNVHLKIAMEIKNKWFELINNSLPIYRIINKHFITILPFNYTVIR